MDYSGKNVLITGAASGIGAAFAAHFAERGARLVLVDVHEEHLTQVAGTLPTKADAHVVKKVDLAVGVERVALFEGLEAQGIQIDVLVNNVGIGYCSHLVDTPWDVIERVIDVNVKGTSHLTWLFLRQMVERDSGAIINVSSTGAFCGANRSAAYTGTKAFVTNFTEAVDMEMFGKNVRTLTAHPGATATRFWESAGTTKMAFYKTVKMMSPEDTVAEFMAAFEKGKASIIAGWRNRLMIFVAKFVPRQLLKTMAVRKYA